MSLLSTKKLHGSDAAESHRRVVLVGNPNVGKSALFNALTGAYVTVSNYPGTSVEVSRGTACIHNEQFEIIDTPGMYALLPITEEERVAREILLTARPDVVVHVADGRNLQRMLPMTLQLIEAGLPLILVVNMMDESERLGLSIDLPLLSRKLGIPVVGAAMSQKRGLDAIRSAICSPGTQVATPVRYDDSLECDIERVAGVLRGDYPLSRRSLALLLLQQQDSEVDALIERTEGDGYPAIAECVDAIACARGAAINLDLSLQWQGMAVEIVRDVMIVPAERRVTVSERLSSLTVHPLTGIPLLVLVLYFGLYRFVGDFGAGTLVDFLEGKLFEELFSPWITGVVTNLVPWWAIRELLTGEYGIITLGLRYAVGIILPIVATFFLFFSLLEDSGYFPRLALLVDRIFKKIGLSGRAVIPMVLGFGCGSMATMVTRTLETTRERVIATLLLTLAIPCSAQLGVILSLLSKNPIILAFWGICMLLIFLLIGFCSARLMPGEDPVFYMELPPLRMPQLANILTKTCTRMQWYFLEILPLFIVASILLWLGKITGFFERLVEWLTPLMHALGLPKEVTIAFIFGFFRRDYGAAGLYDLQSQGVLDARQLTVAAVTLTLFIPCVAQFLIMKKERGLTVSLAIGGFVTAMAFGSGFLLNRFLTATNLL